MPKSTTFADDLLNLIYRAVAIADLAENDATAPLTSIYVSLHTADPGVGGAQTTNEATYGAYARLAIARSGAGWTASSGGSIDNAALAQFVECTSGSNVITHVATGTLSSGAGKVLHAGALSASRTVTAGIQPQFAIGALVITES